MRAVVQRVRSSGVSLNGKLVSSIKSGINVLLAIKKGDNEIDAEYLAAKIMSLRIFTDSEDKMNLSVQEVGGEVLIVSQFTLYGNCRKGNRPSYSLSASAVNAELLYDYFVDYLNSKYNCVIKSGKFQEDMLVSIENDGPVTLIIESKGA